MIARTRCWRGVAVACTLLAAGLLAAACEGGAKTGPEAYTGALAAERAAKDEHFRTGADSPIPAGDRAAFLPLRYFPPDESWSVPASLDPADRSLQPVVDMPTSTGERRRMRRVGVLRFTLQGQRLDLSAFVEAGAPDTNRLLVPFADLTSGTETYGPGRYLDLDRTATGIYVIDFNRAYNPYCAYNAKYDCPYPPAENRLAIAVHAGERVPARPAH